MTTVIKRDKKESSADLVVAINRLIPLLEDQDEHDACVDLKEACQQISRSAVGSSEFASALRKIVDAFEGDHELSAYTHQRANATEWTAAEELAIASSRVINLARRMLK